MATTFTATDATLATTRTLIYTCPASTQAVVFSGTVSNVDSTNRLDHWVTMEVKKVDTSFVAMFTQVPVSFGGSLSVPKVTLLAGEQLHVTGDAAGVLQIRLSIVQKT